MDVSLPYLYPRLFEAHECQKIISSQAAASFEPGRLVEATENYRVCDVATSAESVENTWVFDRLRYIVQLVNPACYDLRLSGCIENLEVIRYREAAKIDWHLDLGPGDVSTRKLSVSVQLSDPAEYSGGDVEFMPRVDFQCAREQGSVLIFPSFLCHRVTPITRGERFSLVTWFHGPTFQ